MGKVDPPCRVAQDCRPHASREESASDLTLPTNCYRCQAELFSPSSHAEEGAEPKSAPADKARRVGCDFTRSLTVAVHQNQRRAATVRERVSVRAATVRERVELKESYRIPLNRDHALGVWTSPYEGTQKK